MSQQNNNELYRSKQKKLHTEFKCKNRKAATTFAEHLAIRIGTHLNKCRHNNFQLGVTTNNTDQVEHMLSLGCNPNSADTFGRSALHVAVSKGYTDIVRLLLGHGADPNIGDKWCNTPLHLAACSHNLAIINLLLDAGADVERLDVHGRNPLQLAETKLQLLQRGWKQGAVEMDQLRTDLKLVRASIVIIM